MSEKAIESGHLTIRRAGQRVEMHMSSDTANLRPARLALEAFIRQAGLAAEIADQIGLVVNEALANVIRHGYGGAKDRPIMVILQRRGQGAETEVEIQIRDWAKPFDPAMLPRPTAAPPGGDADGIKPGGLGLICMHRLMDKVVFTRQPDGMLLTMVKKTGTLEKHG